MSHFAGKIFFIVNLCNPVKHNRLILVFASYIAHFHESETQIKNNLRQILEKKCNFANPILFDIKALNDITLYIHIFAHAFSKNMLMIIIYIIIQTC